MGKEAKMSLFQKIKDLFNQGRYNMQTANLNSILEHPKIAVTQAEYDRISRNLAYYQSRWEDISYTNTDGEIKTRKMQHLLLGRRLKKLLA